MTRSTTRTKKLFQWFQRFQSFTRCGRFKARKAQFKVQLLTWTGLIRHFRARVLGFPKHKIDRVVKLLTDERLLHTEGEGEASTVSISHEKLFEAWPALRDYISVNKKSLMDQTLLENRARMPYTAPKIWAAIRNAEGQ